MPGEHAGMRVALLRHPTPAVPPGLCYGRLDVPLSPEAAGETRQMILALAGWEGAALWCSPLKRCLLPAASIARALGAAAPRVDGRLRELDFGAWEGRPWATVERAALDAWAAAPADFSAPGGEAVRSLVARVRAFWDGLPAGSHVIVTHGGPLKVLAALARGEAVDLLRPTMAYAAIDIVVCRTGDAGGALCFCTSGNRGAKTQETQMASTHDKSDSHSGSHKDPAAGEKHVSQEQVGSGKDKDPNNFANNPERAAAAGRKGGQHSHDRD